MTKDNPFSTNKMSQDHRVGISSQSRSRLWLYVVFMTAAFLYCVLTPPFQAPDEGFHFLKSYQLSTGQLLSHPGFGGLGSEFPRNVGELINEDFSAKDDHPIKRWQWTKIEEALNRPAPFEQKEQAKFFTFLNIAPYSPSLYLPQAVGIRIGRMFDVSPLALMYLGRFFNAAVGVAFLIGAVALVPVGKNIFLAIGALPTTLSQMSSMSADSTIIGLGLLSTAFVIWLFREDRVLRLRERVWFSLLAMSLTLAKGVYLPILLAGLIPMAKVTRSKVVWTTTSLVLGVMAFLSWTAYGGHSGDIQASLISRKTLEITVTARPIEQLKLVLADPLKFVVITATSFVERAPVYVVQIIGRFSNLILMPIGAYVLGVLVLFFGLIVSSPGGWTPSRTQRAWWLLLVFGMTVLVETALYLSGTPLGADYIQGTQGRYFTPFIGLLCLALMFRVRSPTAGAVLKWLFPLSVTALVITGLVVAFNAYWVRGFVE